MAMLGSDYWGGGGRRDGLLPDPFNDLASQALPRTQADALRWCQSVAQVDCTFREAMERVASYFITDIEIKSPTKIHGKEISEEAKTKFSDFLRKTLLIELTLRRAAMDYLVYGNVFVSVLPPILRKLSCPNCPELIYPLRVVYEGPEFDFRWDPSTCSFNARCPRCKKRNNFNCHEEMGGPESEVALKIWNVHEIDIRHDLFSDRKQYIWKIPDTYRRQVREGKLMELETAPMEVLRAATKNVNFRFHPKVVYHMYDPPLCGVDHAGWGFSKPLVNFRQVYHNQTLTRFNEAICQEHLLPFRLISPAARSGSDAAADPLLGLNLNDFRAQMAGMIRRHRRDPNQIQISPVPVEYQMLGGDGNQLAPYQLIEQARDTLLNGSGVPADLYKMTLSLQAAPVGLRLFESRWKGLVSQLNQLLEAIVDQVSHLFSWEPVDAKLKRVTHADDLNRQMALLQLMMSGQVSQTTGMNSVGVDFRTEQENLIAESKLVSDLQQTATEQQAGQQTFGQMAAASGAQPFAGGGAQGGAAQGGAQGQATSPQQLEDQSQQIVAQLQQVDESQRRQYLSQLKQDSPPLHALVMQQMQDAKRQQSQQAKQGPGVKAAARRAPTLLQIGYAIAMRRAG